VTGIPRKLVFRILANVLGGHARQLAGRAQGSVRRRGAQAVEGALSKGEQQQILASDVMSQADELGGWIGDDSKCSGPDLPAELVGHLCALALGHGYAVPEVRRIANGLAGPGVLDGVDFRDIPAVVSRLL
jgi:hypothetical protein